MLVVSNQCSWISFAALRKMNLVCQKFFFFFGARAVQKVKRFQRSKHYPQLWEGYSLLETISCNSTKNHMSRLSEKDVALFNCPMIKSYVLANHHCMVKCNILLKYFIKYLTVLNLLHLKGFQPIFLAKFPDLP